MKSIPSIVASFAILACAIASLAGCSGGGSGGSGGGSGGGGISGVYTSVDNAEITIEFKSDGTAVASMGGEKGKPGTYTVEGEKIIVQMPDSIPVTFIRDGDCIADTQNIFGKMCKGGAAGAAKNVSTRTPPATTGTWSATNADGTFTIEFQPGDKFTFAFTPVAGSQMGDKPFTKPGKFEMEGDVLYTQLDDSTPMVLKWVNGAYESSAFGLPMKFTKK